jgi:glyoxylate reductase
MGSDSLKRAFITRALPEEALAIAREAAQLDIWEGDGPPPRAELIARASQADGLLCLLTDRIDAEMLDACPSLRVVSQMAVGYDNIDVAACSARGIAVGNTPGVLTETTADLAFALLLATARRVTEAEQFLRNGEWTTWSPLLLAGTDVFGATLGIVGMGRIGAAVAKRAAGFSMRILYSSTRRHEDVEESTGAVYADLDRLLAESDFVSLHMPLSATTRHMVGAEQIARMKPTAMLINTARGPVVDEAALAEALRVRQIAAAGLDVFEREPLAADSPLLGLDNVVLLPHIGSASIATRTKMAVLAACNLAAGLRGEPLPYPVKSTA